MLSCFIEVFGMNTKQVLDSEPLIATPEAAAMLGVSTGTLEVWRCTNRYSVPYVRLGRAIRYSPAALRAWIAARAVNSAAAE